MFGPVLGGHIDRVLDGELLIFEMMALRLLRFHQSLGRSSSSLVHHLQNGVLRIDAGMVEYQEAEVSSQSLLVRYLFL